MKVQVEGPCCTCEQADCDEITDDRSCHARMVQLRDHDECDFAGTQLMIYFLMRPFALY